MLLFLTQRLGAYDTVKLLNTLGNDCVVMNLNSLIEIKCPRLSCLNVYWNMSQSIIYRDDNYFDNNFVNYLTSDKLAFKEIIDIMRICYNGYNVVILCDMSNEVNTNITEAIIKFINDTYGYICNVVNTVDDLMNLKEGSFSTKGIQIFDANMETYIKLFGTNNLMSSE